MKGYIKYIKYDLIFIAFLLVAIFLLSGIKKAGTDRAERMNAECVTQERVFDYADKLTDAQEEKLRKLIAKREKQIQADIVIVTLDEQMTDYDVMVYSDDLQDSWKFGYNEPYGNCAMLVDNWGTGYMWFHTAGNVLNKYNSDARIDFLLDKTCEYVNMSPYLGYRAYVNTLTKNMQGTVFFTWYVPHLAVFIFALIVTIVFLWINLYKRGARKTTTSSTYMKNQAYQVRRREDLFIGKNVVQRRIETSNRGGGGGGGGGSHRSGGGHSYGGGGRHH